MLILKANSEFKNADDMRELMTIKDYILTNKPKVLVVPAWVEVIEVSDIQEGEENETTENV